LLRSELEGLYMRRLAVDAAIHELELLQLALAAARENAPSKTGLEFSSSPSNLTSCRNA
jgi:hypothetical protein